MTKITQADIYAGRKRLKGLTEECRERAELIRAEGGKEAAHLRDLMRFHYGLKAKNLDSLAIVKNGDVYVSMLILTDAPRGMPNVIAAPIAPLTEAEALDNARGLLDAAWVKVLDYKAEMAAGTADNLRLFEAGPLALSVPWEVMNIIAKRIPVKTPQKQLDKIRDEAMKRLNEITDNGNMDEQGFLALKDDGQLELMVEAAKALCTGANQLVAA